MSALKVCVVLSVPLENEVLPDLQVPEDSKDSLAHQETRVLTEKMESRVFKDLLVSPEVLVFVV